MYYYLVGALLGCSWVFPWLLWRTKVKNSDVNIIFFDIQRDSENPFLKEATTVTMYDLRKEVVYTASNAQNHATSEELEHLMSKIMMANTVPIFVTFDDTGFKRSCLKSLLQGVDGTKDLRIMDIKTLFYYTNPQVQSTSYEDLVAYYQLEQSNVVVDYANMFTHIALDYNPNIMHQLAKVNEMYDDIMQMC